MIKFDRTWFGGVSVDGKNYRDILVIGNEIIDRGKWGWFDTHIISERELNELLRENPEVIIIGNGIYGALKVPISVEEKIKRKRIELIVEKTQKAIEVYNELSKKKRVNILIHTTC